MADLAPSNRPVPSSAGRTRRHRALLVIAVLALVGAGGVEGWRLLHAAPVVRYTTVRVTRGAVTRSITASGSVNPETTIQVGTYVSGVIQALYCDYNTRVHKGQLCATIDPRPYQVALDQDRANLAEANAQLSKDQTTLGYAKLTYDRTLDLSQRSIVSQDTLDSAKSTYDQAVSQIALDKASVDQHQAAVSAAEINLAYTDIVSPVDGTVVSRSVTMGQTVAASFQTPTLFLIATDLTRMQVDANVSESDIGGIHQGDAASFTVEAFPNRAFTGQVTQVRQAPQTVQNVVTYDVVIGVANPDLVLMPGMTATARIVIERHADVVRVPNQALRYTPGGLAAAGTTGARAPAEAHVWILQNGRPVAVAVTVGLDDDAFTEITSGTLKAGDEIVTSEQAGPASAGAGRLSFRL
jgi:HlyD family secretion protein